MAKRTRSLLTDMMKNKTKDSSNNSVIKLPIATVFLLFLIFSTLVFAIGISIFVTFQVDKLIRNNQQEFISQGMYSLSKELSYFLDNRYNMLKDYAKMPIVVQSVMQPETNRDNISDFIDGLLIFGEKVPIALLDFSGGTIYTTANNYKDREFQLEDISSIDESKFNFFVDTKNNKKEWHLITPVYYHNNVEGFLVAIIKENKIVNALSLAKHSKHHHIQISRAGSTLLELGTPNTTTKETIDIKDLDLQLVFSTNEASLDINRKPLLTKLATSLLIIWTVIIILFRKFGHQYLILPLQQLLVYVHQLSEGKHVENNSISISPSNQRISEISELENQFKSMITKIYQREDSLYKAKEKLEVINTQLVEQQQQLVQSEKMASVGQLAAGVAHEINNPTGFVMGNLEVLKDYLNSIKKLLEHYSNLEENITTNDYDTLSKQIQTINQLKEDEDINFILEDLEALLSDSVKGTKRIQKIVQDLKSFSRVDDSDLKEVDLNEEVIEIAIRLVWNQLKYKCELNKELKPLPPFSCKPGEISQVVMNLLLNASDAIEESGEISINSYYKNDQIFIEVSDTGSGIDENYKLKLFDPFFTTKEVGKGTGLGLSISHEIISKHGGTLTVESEVNKGSKFIISLPLERQLDTAQVN